jgi:atypical dual specificity phosphatase
MSEITDQIWIGSYGDTANESFLEERQITQILCCAEELPLRVGFPYSQRYEGYKVPLIDDVADEKTKGYFLEGATVLDEWVNTGKNCIVHCFAGISRSVSVVITYLMVYKGWSYELAFNHIKLRRPRMNPHPDFIPILKAIESKLPHSPPPLQGSLAQ